MNNPHIYVVKIMMFFETLSKHLLSRNSVTFRFGNRITLASNHIQNFDFTTGSIKICLRLSVEFAISARGYPLWLRLTRLLLHHSTAGNKRHFR